jgi:hypothetical protein
VARERGGGGGGGQEKPRGFGENEAEGKGAAKNNQIKEEKEKRKGNNRRFDEKSGRGEEDGEGRAEVPDHRWNKRRGCRSRLAVGRMGAKVGKEGKEGEEQGKDILAFGNPCYGFNAEGVDGPKEREEKGKKQGGFVVAGFVGWPAKKTAEMEKDKEKEDGVGRVEGDIRGMEG